MTPKTPNTLNPKKNSMTMTVNASDPSAVLRSIDMHLLHEALSRARMPQPHDEASRTAGARDVAVRARAQQARELGEPQRGDAR